MTTQNGLPSSYDADMSHDPRDTPEKLARDDAMMDEWARRRRIHDALASIDIDLRDMADELDDDDITIDAHWFETQWAKIGEAWGRMERAAGVQGNGKP